MEPHCPSANQQVGKLCQHLNQMAYKMTDNTQNGTALVVPFRVSSGRAEAEHKAEKVYLTAIQFLHIFKGAENFCPSTQA